MIQRSEDHGLTIYENQERLGTHSSSSPSPLQANALKRITYSAREEPSLAPLLSYHTLHAILQVENLASQAKEWCLPPVIPALKLPGPNPFVPRDLSVIKPKGRVVKPGDKTDPPSEVEVLPTTAGWKVGVFCFSTCLRLLSLSCYFVLFFLLKASSIVRPSSFAAFVFDISVWGFGSGTAVGGCANAPFRPELRVLCVCSW